MSIVLSYRALRDVPLSPDEAAAIDIVIARYQSDFEYRDAADAFTVHPTDPTAPADTSLAKCPSTMMSDALYNSCKIPVSIMGRQNKTIFHNRGRVHISSSFFVRTVLMATIIARTRQK